MNDYEYRYIIEEQKREQNIINREAWKYESSYRDQVPFSIKSLKSVLTRKWFQKQQCVSCCKC